MASTKLISIFKEHSYSDADREALVRNKLMGFYREKDSQTFKNQWLLNQGYFDELSTWQLPKELSGIMLKGGHLIPKFYTHPGERFMGDIDILIPLDEMSGWCHFLIEQGYKDITKDSWAANHFKKIFLKTSGSLEFVIELHTRLFYQENSNLIWQRGEASPYPGLSYLDTNDLFIHLCGHLAYQHTFLSLHWLYDIYLLLTQKKLDPLQVRAKAKQARVWRSCQIISYILKTKLEVELPPELMPGPFIKLFTRLLITDDFLLNPKNSFLRYFLVKHLTKDHLYQALLYDFEWFRHKRSA